MHAREHPAIHMEGRMVRLDVTILSSPDGGARITPVVWRDDSSTPDEEWMAREFDRLVRSAVTTVAEGLRKRHTAGGAPEAIDVPGPSKPEDA